MERYLSTIVTPCTSNLIELYKYIINRDNEHGANLPVGKKVKVTGANLHDVWKKHKPTLDL